MFAKLLKHELRSQKGIMLILSLAALGVGLLGGLLMWLLSHNLGSIYSGAIPDDRAFMGMYFAMILMIGAVFTIGAYAIAVWILLLLRFYKRCFSNEGYLTFTLPATTHQILFSSIVNIVIWVVACAVVCAISLGMIFAPLTHLAMENSGVEMMIAESVLEEAWHYYGGFGQIFSVLSSCIFSLVLPLLSITIGSLVAKKLKLLASFGIYYGITIAISLLTGILSTVAIFAAISSDAIYELSIYLPAVVELCIGVGGYCLMHQLVDKKLNLP